MLYIYVANVTFKSTGCWWFKRPKGWSGILNIQLIIIKCPINVGTGQLKSNEVSYICHQIKSWKHQDKENETGKCQAASKRTSIWAQIVQTPKSVLSIVPAKLLIVTKALDDSKSHQCALHTYIIIFCTYNASQVAQW